MKQQGFCVFSAEVTLTSERSHWRSKLTKSVLPTRAHCGSEQLPARAESHASATLKEVPTPLEEETGGKRKSLRGKSEYEEARCRKYLTSVFAVMYPEYRNS